MTEILLSVRRQLSIRTMRVAPNDSDENKAKNRRVELVRL